MFFSLGVILLDEMKLSERLDVDKESSKIIGYTDLGKHTPQNQLQKQGDHALVIIFQPFRGKWIQAVASFLSKGAANGDVLHKIVMEAVIELEKAGLFVDGVVSDGAQWNRGMWRHFGIHEEQVSCQHFWDETRNLWFFSDFPHLLKNIRNWVISSDNFQVIIQYILQHVI